MEDNQVSVNTTQNTMRTSHPWAKVIAVIAVLIAISAGIFAYLEYSQAKQATSDKDATAQQLNASQKTVSDLSSQVETLQAKLNSSTTSSSSSATTKSDEDMIKEAAIAYDQASASPTGSSLVVTVSKIELPFARADLHMSEGSGWACIFKKSGVVWLQLYCAQADSDYTLAIDEEYNVPASIKQ